MKFSRLTEEKVAKITSILEKESIPYEVKIDRSQISQNEDLLQQPLQYLNPGSIHTDVLMITVDEEKLALVSSKAKESLLELGIAVDIPDELFEKESIETAIVKQESSSNNILYIILVLLTICLIIYIFFSGNYSKPGL